MLLKLIILFPQALSDLLGVKAGSMASVVLDKATHAGYSKEWNKVLDTIRQAPDTKKAILQEAERIYKDAPDLLKSTKDLLNTL